MAGAIERADGQSAGYGPRHRSSRNLALIALNLRWDAARVAIDSNNKSTWSICYAAAETRRNRTETPSNAATHFAEAVAAVGRVKILGGEEKSQKLDAAAAAARLEQEATVC